MAARRARRQCRDAVVLLLWKNKDKAPPPPAGRLACNPRRERKGCECLINARSSDEAVQPSCYTQRGQQRCCVVISFWSWAGEQKSGGRGAAAGVVASLLLLHINRPR